jgi:hypothetical protein
VFAGELVALFSKNRSASLERVVSRELAYSRGRISSTSLSILCGVGVFVAEATAAADVAVVAAAAGIAAGTAVATGKSVVESRRGFGSVTTLAFGSLTSSELSCSSEVIRVRGSGAGCISRSGTGEGALALSGTAGESKSDGVGGGDAGDAAEGGDAGGGSRSDAAGICAEVVSTGCPSVCVLGMAGAPPTGAGVIELMFGQRLWVSREDSAVFGPSSWVGEAPAVSVPGFSADPSGSAGVPPVTLMFSSIRLP